ncbi:hypothetical protein EVA_18908 [gut metagenome]|uniref:Uncharacterized protein n=1 Tax=gut metagenome TaxID=749906 RepID=J9G059_9ZZZZ
MNSFSASRSASSERDGVRREASAPSVGRTESARVLPG